MSKQEHEEQQEQGTSAAADVMPTHTPGPWTPCTTSRGAVGVRARMGAMIATTLKADAWDVSMEKPEAKANAALMAAALEMKKRLEEARSAIASLDEDALGRAHTDEGEPIYPYRDELLHNIDEALAKARSE